MTGTADTRSHRSKGRAGSHARVQRLQLVNFRSYRRAEVSVGEGPIVLTGPNGAGKTSLLEALSLLAPGRGLRRAALDELAAGDGDGSWAVVADVHGALGEVRLGTGIDAPAENTVLQRRFRIDGEPVPSAAAFADHLRIIWLTPEMDSLFLGPASDRRRFLDRLVLAIDLGHSTRVNALERALRSRNRLLEDPQPDTRWLDAVEHELAELAVAVAAGRGETVRRLSDEIHHARDPQSLFPSPALALEGWRDEEWATSAAVEIEDRYRQSLREARPRDRAAGRTLEGPHLSDLAVFHAGKGVEAARCSTGERKALLVGVVLAHARLVAAMHDCAPLALLDDVAAFLDSDRRSALFAALAGLGAQVWMTGIDASAFAPLGVDCEQFRVDRGRLEPAG